MLVLISFISRKGSALRQHRSQLCEEQKDTLLRQRSKKKEKDVKIVCILPSSHVGRTLNVAAIRFPKIFAHFTGWIGENRARQLSSCGSGYRSRAASSISTSSSTRRRDNRRLLFYSVVHNATHLFTKHFAVDCSSTQSRYRNDTS